MMQCNDLPSHDGITRHGCRPLLLFYYLLVRPSPCALPGPSRFLLRYMLTDGALKKEVEKAGLTSDPTASKVGRSCRCPGRSVGRLYEFCTKLPKEIPRLGQETDGGHCAFLQRAEERDKTNCECEDTAGVGIREHMLVELHLMPGVVNTAHHTWRTQQPMGPEPNWHAARPRARLANDRATTTEAEGWQYIRPGSSINDVNPSRGWTKSRITIFGFALCGGYVVWSKRSRWRRSGHQWQHASVTPACFACPGPHCPRCCRTS